MNSNSFQAKLLRLYQRSDPEDHRAEDIAADVVHHFLLAICTRPGTGICFKDRGWYPREDLEAGVDGSAQLAGPSRPSSRVYNIILANVLKTLKVNEDARQQELAYRILKVCPELVAGCVCSQLHLQPYAQMRMFDQLLACRIADPGTTPVLSMDREYRIFWRRDLAPSPYNIFPSFRQRSLSTVPAAPHDND